MTLSTRPVHHDSETLQLLRLLQTNLPDLPHERRYQWLYRGNPDGPAWSWFACHGKASQPVGVASVFPRSMWVGDQLQMCGQVGDFAIDVGHRSLGPALLLQRATFAPVDQGKLAFCYDCPPHEAGMSTFRRLSMRPNCVMERYVLPLRVDAYVRKRFGFGAAIPASIGNLLLRAYRWSASRSRPRDLEIAEHDGPFGEEFSRLDNSVKDAKVIRGQRSAAHLNWRYRDDPLQRYRVLVARRNGELLAFVVYCVAPEVITIVDVFGRDLRVAGMALLASLVERFERSHQSIEAFLSNGSESDQCFLNMHFRRRSQTARVVAYAKPSGCTSAFLQSGPNWAFHQAELRA